MSAHYANGRQFVPHLFIGVGLTGAYFTLRMTNLRYIPGEGPMGNAIVNGVYQGTVEVGSEHLFNLSQDADEAFEKAQAAAQEMALRLSSTRESLDQEMREIQRATAEQMAERAARDAERVARLKEFYAAEDARKREMIMGGKFSHGQYEGQEFAEAPRSYLTWLVCTKADFDEGSLMRLLAEQVELRCAQLLLPAPKAGVYAGKPGVRAVFSATVLRCMRFDGFYGPTFITLMVDKATGACLVSKSGSFRAEAGEELEFKATVKAHEQYKGAAQTVVQRIAVLEAA